jgi:hypothetical protein
LDVKSSIPTALLLHDGELSDLRPLLDEIGVADAEPSRKWDLVIATPPRKGPGCPREAQWKECTLAAAEKIPLKPPIPEKDPDHRLQTASAVLERLTEIEPD